jgi:tRNA(fMet)-specific endonuclease VapC
VTDQADAEDSPAHAVIDTMIATAILVGTRNTVTADILQRYEHHLRGISVVLAFATVCELRYGALKGGWGSKRINSMESWFNKVSIVLPDNDLVNVCATLRFECEQQGHGLRDKIHDSDRWIASTAIRYEVPLISDDTVFRGAPRLNLLQQRRAAAT